jgi:hypothetical protein
MGLSASYSVTATGTSLQYQWAKNGTAIAGATSTTYTTPATAFSDNGASFTVAVSNSAGSISSEAASLTVTARAPMAGDLRFQQVDAPSTVNGYGNNGGVAFGISDNTAIDYSPSIGSPFFVGTSPACAPTTVELAGTCDWSFVEFGLASSAATAGLTIAYMPDSYANFPLDLQASSGVTANPFLTGITPASSSSVVNSLDLEPLASVCAFSWIQSAQQTGFDARVETVPLAGLQSAATIDGSNGRVVTAISYDNGQATFISYGWSADLATQYEVQVVNTSTGDAPTAAAGLASQGYIITATGRADDNGAIFLVGTRVQGDSMPRPFIGAQGALAGGQTYVQLGYATVGVIFDASQTDYLTFLGER